MDWIKQPGLQAGPGGARGKEGWSLTLEEGSEFTGQSSRGELVFALLLGADDFPGGGGGESWGEAWL